MRLKVVMYIHILVCTFPANDQDNETMEIKETAIKSLTFLFSLLFR